MWNFDLFRNFPLAYLHITYVPDDCITILKILKLLNRDFTSTQYDSEIKFNRGTNLEQKQIEIFI